MFKKGGEGAVKKKGRPERWTSVGGAGGVLKEGNIRRSAALPVSVIGSVLESRDVVVLNFFSLVDLTPT